MIGKKQIPKRFQKVIDDELAVFNKNQSIRTVKKTPSVKSNYPQNQPSWDNIPLVICVFIDMLGSTRLSSELRNKTFARAYLFYVETALRLIDKFNPSYINVHGDGVFAIFDKDYPYTALAAAITFKTFSEEVFTPILADTIGKKAGSHIGIDQNTVILGKVSLKEPNKPNIRLNEIWAGTPVNMAAKLAALSKNNEILVSERYFRRLKNGLDSCLCSCLNKKQLWSKKDFTSNKSFDFNSAYGLGIEWCKEHGADGCGRLLALDKNLIK